MAESSPVIVRLSKAWRGYLNKGVGQDSTKLPGAHRAAALAYQSVIAGYAPAALQLMATQVAGLVVVLKRIEPPASALSSD